MPIIGIAEEELGIFPKKVCKCLCFPQNKLYCSYLIGYYSTK